MTTSHAALSFFQRAVSYVEHAGLNHEIEWQRTLRFDAFTESDLLRESAWVILCSGFKEATIRKKFDYISLCFCDWESAQAIVAQRDVCEQTAMSTLRSPRKLRAISDLATLITRAGFASLKQAILSNPLGVLETFPFIGPITKWHLAKNLGHDVAKPDRHLVRLGNEFGFSSAHELCSFISTNTGEPVNVVDLVLWRFVADRTYKGTSPDQLVEAC